MNIKVTLEDEGLCKGCPFGNGLIECHGGFKRECAKLFETAYYDPYRMIVGGDAKQKQISYDFVRPQACMLATEHAAVAITKLKEK